MDLTIVQIAEKLAGAGAATGLILILYGGYKGWWIYGRQLQEERQDHSRECDSLRKELEVLRNERNEYKTLLFRTLRVTETAVEVAKTTTPPSASP